MLTLLTALTLSAADAEACSPPLSEDVATLPANGAQDVALDQRIVARVGVDLVRGQEPLLVVQLDDGQPVLGTATAQWLQSPDGWTSEWLVVFEPSEMLPADAIVSVQISDGLNGEEAPAVVYAASFETGDRVIADAHAGFVPNGWIEGWTEHAQDECEGDRRVVDLQLELEGLDLASAMVEIHHVEGWDPGQYELGEPDWVVLPQVDGDWVQITAPVDDLGAAGTDCFHVVAVDGRGERFEAEFGQCTWNDENWVCGTGGGVGWWLGCSSVGGSGSTGLVGLLAGLVALVGFRRRRD